MSQEFNEMEHLERQIIKRYNELLKTLLKGKNPELVEMLNKGLADLKESGKYDEIVNTYISK